MRGVTDIREDMKVRSRVTVMGAPPACIYFLCSSQPRLANSIFRKDRIGKYNQRIQARTVPILRLHLTLPL